MTATTSSIVSFELTPCGEPPMVGEPPQPASSSLSSASADLMSANPPANWQTVNFLYGSLGPCLKLGLSATTTGAREYPTLVAARCVLSTTAMRPSEDRKST